jgi:hypothetical protein
MHVTAKADRNSYLEKVCGKHQTPPMEAWQVCLMQWHIGDEMKPDLSTDAILMPEQR